MISGRQKYRFKQIDRETNREKDKQGERQTNGKIDKFTHGVVGNGACGDRRPV